jgi:hypothetical protein
MRPLDRCLEAVDSQNAAAFWMRRRVFVIRSGHHHLRTRARRSNVQPPAAPLNGRTCGHPLSAHDVISLRWCAASELGVDDRACICSSVVQATRVLTHY